MQVGLDALAATESPLRPLVERLRGGRVGLLAHAASVDRRYRHAVDVLVELGATPVTLFGPEHGFGGAAQDMIGVGDAVDPRTGARVVSLYGDEADDLVPKASDLEPLDVLVIDLVDVGARYYTYVWTALIAAREAAKVDTHVVILDRPNPIGDRIEGRTVDAGFGSFVGYEPVPIRHGLTLGTMAALHLASDGVALGPEGAVSVVGVRGLPVGALASAWDRPFVLPSPNMPTFDTALVYPGGCLLEGTNLSEGRGHTRPFEIWGAPWLDGAALAEQLAGTGLPGVTCRPLSFIPTFHKHGGKVCGGVQVHVTDVDTFRPVATYVALIALARRQDPERFAFRTERYEYIDHIPAFDLLTGSPQAREAIEAGEPARDIAEMVSRVSPAWTSRKADAAEALVTASW
ncbi:MAG: DUF1343 domain-containing protein [Polyangiaceae bacterium]